MVEQAPEIGEVGAGVGLSPATMKAVAYLGCEEQVLATGVAHDSSEWRALETGRVMWSSDDRVLAERYGAPFVSMYRPDLIDALRSAAPGAQVVVGSRVVGFEETATDVLVALESGDEFRGDVLIGADGLKSVVRQQLFGQEDPRFVGISAWRGVIRLPEDGILPGSEVNWRLPERLFYAGPAGLIITYTVHGGDLLNVVADVFASDERRESWSLSDDPEQARRAFSSGCDDVQAVLAALDETFVTAFYDRPALARWSTDRVSLVGDAAHPIVSHAGSGAAMAIEDAVALGHALGRHGAGGVAAGLAEYEARRRPRTTRVMVYGKHNIDSAMGIERDEAYRVAEEGRREGRARLNVSERFIDGDWLWGHDPVRELEDLPAELRAPTRPEARRAFDAWRTALDYDDLPTWRTQRAGYERFCARAFPPPDSLRWEEIDCGGVAAIRVTPPGSGGGPLVLHLHGGAFSFGSARGSVELAGRLAAAVGGSAVVVDYRLAPEHPYPAALEDALTVYRTLDAEEVLLTGEDAGGGLAISLACALRDAGDPSPIGLYVVSPLCDLTLSSPSIDDAPDPWLTREALIDFASSYIQSEDPRTPLLSPVHGDLAGLPPLLVHVAAGEALEDDARRLAEAAERAGVPTTLRAFPDTVHSFVLFDFLPETRTALDELADFVRTSASVPR